MEKVYRFGFALGSEDFDRQVINPYITQGELGDAQNVGFIIDQ
jgi:hypothetical protein